MQYTERMKLAFNYAEESSRRARWILFMMQLAVVLVIATVWQENNSNWTFSRLRVAQNTVKLLSCNPEYEYGQDAVKQVNKSFPDAKDAATSPFTLEYRDSRYVCQKGMSSSEIKEAQDYENIRHFSLIEAKKNVADLQQLVTTRALSVNVPILGLNFDVNDLDIVSGLTFVILLSWLHFALRRQHRNVRHVFNMARRAEDPEEKDKTLRLRIAYNLLAMTQVLTVPAARHEDLRVAPLKRLTQPSGLIVWTAVLAQALMVFDDFRTASLGQIFSNRITWIETGAAVILLVYIVIRTRACSRVMKKTYELWDEAFQEAYPLEPQSTGPNPVPADLTLR